MSASALAPRNSGGGWSVSPAVATARATADEFPSPTRLGARLERSAVVRAPLAPRHHREHPRPVVRSIARLVGELVKLDRLPNETSLQGLLLLRSAWSEYDTTMMLAGRYKWQAKLIFLYQYYYYLLLLHQHHDLKVYFLLHLQYSFLLYDQLLR